MPDRRINLLTGRFYSCRIVAQHRDVVAFRDEKPGGELHIALGAPQIVEETLHPRDAASDSAKRERRYAFQAPLHVAGYVVKNGLNVAPPEGRVHFLDQSFVLFTHGLKIPLWGDYTPTLASGDFPVCEFDQLIAAAAHANGNVAQGFALKTQAWRLIVVGTAQAAEFAVGHLLEILNRVLELLDGVLRG
jgi:hypothetical protein